LLFRSLISDVCGVGIHFGSPENLVKIRQIGFFTASKREKWRTRGYLMSTFGNSSVILAALKWPTRPQIPP
jgi:hypothetical protein